MPSTDPVRRRETDRTSYARHRDARVAQMKAYDAAHDEEKRARMRRHYLANREQRLAYQREYNARRGSDPNVTRRAAAWQERNSEARAAHRVVARAIAAGRVERQPCGLCGVEGGRAHHAFGYSPERALDVWWLCVPHHADLHRFMRDQLEGASS